MSDIGFSPAPTLSDELLERCRVSGDFREAAFEWYKHVACLAAQFANLRDTGGMRSIAPSKLAALSGLLIRCAKLMLANLRLSAECGGQGEATTILDRSITESAAKARWLCQPATEDRFVRFAADGLKAEIRLKETMENNIMERGRASSKDEC